MKLIGCILFFVFILFGCNSNRANYKISNNQNIEFAKHFTIVKKNNKTIIYIIHPDNNTIDKILYIDRNEPNAIWYNDIKFHSNSLISFSSTFIGLLDKLNELHRIKGVDNKNLIFNKEIIKKINNESIKELGSAETTSTKKIINTKSELILFSGFGHEFPNEKKLKKLNILCLPIYDWKETHPLGKAEWIKLFGLLTNKEKEANLYFENLKKRYQSIKQQYKNIKLSKLLFSGSLIGDFWYLPAGDSYMVKLFKDARINYVAQNSKGTGSVSKSFEYCLKNYKNANYWLNPNSKSIKSLVAQNEKYRLFDALKQNTYCYSHNPNLYWEKSAIEPDSLLMDLIQISHPELKLKRKLYFYKKLN
ncbi:MAG: ABC transporter substrate-binding protein [Crocinitomicaceae bacterium]|jgi:iron complex transport system substrate-binding protein